MRWLIGIDLFIFGFICISALYSLRRDPVVSAINFYGWILFLAAAVAGFMGLLFGWGI